MTNNKGTNFNDAADQISYELIPHKTIAKVAMIIKKGGWVSLEWPDGYTTKSKAGTSVYLACEFTILRGPYKKKYGLTLVFIAIIHRNMVKSVEV